MVPFFPYSNLKGVAILCVAFLPTLAMRGVKAQLLFILWGALIAAFDLGYRYQWLRPRLAALPPSREGRTRWDVDLGRIWWISNDGGMLALLPAWVVGLIIGVASLDLWGTGMWG